MASKKFVNCSDIIGFLIFQTPLEDVRRCWFSPLAPIIGPLGAVDVIMLEESP